jgi:hypothetical protein
LVSGSQSYIEDCQICCRPILLQIEIRHGSLKSLKYSGLEDACAALHSASGCRAEMASVFLGPVIPDA